MECGYGGGLNLVVVLGVEREVAYALLFYDVTPESSAGCLWGGVAKRHCTYLGT